MKKWNVKQPDEPRQRSLSNALGISRAIGQLLINRGLYDIEQARTFLTGGIAELYNPFLMEGMHEAVARLNRAIAKKEKILIHGDYDVDGITSISILIFTLRGLGVDPLYYIPDRLTEGYGLSSGGVEEAIKAGARLVVTVDCGISSSKEVESLNSHGIDVIITDHHEVPEVLPPAYAIINPLQKHCAYPDKNLSGVSVTFKLCEALCSEFHNKDVWQHLDLVALGTVSDVAPLIGENRILVKEGLKLLKNGGANKGIRALIEVSGIKTKEPGSFEIGFILGPRINAAGRLGSAREAVELFLTDDDAKAKSLAEKLNKANRERQKIEGLTLKEAMSKVEREINFKEHKVIVLHKEEWHTGVIGIVASRIADRFYRPCILISTKDGVGRGSGRSIENFHLFEAIAGCGDFLKEYGGHKYACGLTIGEENLANFIKSINEIADTVLTSDDLIPGLDIDMEISLGSLDDGVIEDMNRLQPFGESNPEPVFCSRNLKLVRPARIIKSEHVKLWVSDGGRTFEAIGFGLARNSDIEAVIKKSPAMDLAYTVSFNHWQGTQTIQLKIKDIRAAHP
ncbi:MAG: single-stranded-DNA-specific exonuclease RecJ [Candidatus Omnitrophica bacterium]|nr:single-stranded-DNA-specific exonuclease RecJ [Candidatus Omnitrophota bacterium]